MASTYSLPVSPIPHSHGHLHSHSHSHSPALSSKLGPGGQKAANTSRSLRQERSNGSLHSHTRSDFLYDHWHSHANTHLHEHPQANMNLHTPQYSKGLMLGGGQADIYSHDHSPAYSQSNGYELSPLGASHSQHDDLHHDHSHHDHAHHGHSHHDHAHHDLAHHDLAHHDLAHHDLAHHDLAHHDHLHHRHSHGASENRSRFSRTILLYAERWPLLHSILKEKDSRRIFYFMSLNFTFMAVQAFYGFVTNSLGLLSDSIHMFFDCLALGLGLFAAVSSKWPPSERFPYGFGKIESLSGFGNGVFLMLISIEILVEAVERLADGRETKRLTELLIVSSLGFAVNLVGMACFGHHHHSHDHSHGGCDHTHSHANDSVKTNAGNRDHTGLSPMSVDATSPPQSHGHSHENENMRGIFLHVLADTMGSAAVIVSTLLIQYVGWSGWDPLASCIIAVLIFLSSMPLVASCAKKLLLTVPADAEYQLRNTLAGVSGLRGVASYTVPRFWMADKVSGTEGTGVLGVIHVIAIRGSDLDDVRDRAKAFLSSHGMDVVLQVEREGDGKCWCGGDSTKSPSSSRFS